MTMGAHERYAAGLSHSEDLTWCYKNGKVSRNGIASACSATLSTLP